MRLFASVVCALVASFAVGPMAVGAQSERIQYSEAREPCADYDPLKQAYFGNLHQHTKRSFDASLRIVRVTPDEAYKFARGLTTVTTPDQFGFQTRRTFLDRPLDFLALTDHSEFFGEVGICQDVSVFSGEPSRNSLECALLNQYIGGPSTLPVPLLQRTIGTAAFTLLTIPGLGPGFFNTPTPMCMRTLSGCKEAELSVWHEMISVAEANYDKTSACTFTTFVGYENTSTPTVVNHHRNVIFRNSDVIERPITAIDLATIPNPIPTRQVVSPFLGVNPDPTKLWNGLIEQCLARPGNCDVVVIPHNTNLATSIIPTVTTLMADPPGATLARKRINARIMQEVQPLIEIYQTKGGSECRTDPRFFDTFADEPWLVQTGYSEADYVFNGNSVDEDCDFELLDGATLLTASGVGNVDLGSPDPTEFDDRAYVRGVLKDGLLLGQEPGLGCPGCIGINPFKLGIGGSTDDHNGRPGFVPEDRTANGHLGIEDAIPSRSPGTMQNSSGGLWAVWAEENSRDAIFDGLKAKETYGTSGTRPTVRFFGGWEYGRNVCNRNFVKKGYEKGVPMGGELPPQVGSRAPRFIVAADKDDIVGTDLHKIQIIKGWVEDGVAREATYDVAVAGDGGTVNNRCMPRNTGAPSLCARWVDPDFNPDQDAFYYARVLEDQVCRYSTDWCISRYGLNPLRPRQCNRRLDFIAQTFPLLFPNVSQCCANDLGTTPQDAPYVEPLIQERAWTSPIWYTAPR